MRQGEGEGGGELGRGGCWTAGGEGEPAPSLSSPERWAGRRGRGLEVSRSQTMTRIK